MKPRIALVASLTVGFLLCQAARAVEDVTPTGRSEGSPLPLLVVGLAFVLIVSGLSFVLLRRMALRRRVSAQPDVEHGGPQ